MSSSLFKIAPVGFRLARASKATWTKTASRTFSGIIAQNIATPTTASYKNQRTFSSNASPSLAECLSTEIQSELAEDEIDHEFLDAKKQTEKLFEISDSKGEGETLPVQRLSFEFMQIENEMSQLPPSYMHIQGWARF